MRIAPEVLLSHADFVRGLARSLLRDPAAAEDAAQDALLRALERPPRVETSLRSWLHSVTRNFARQDARGAGRRRWHEAAAAREEPLPSAADVLEREAIRAEVVQAVLALSEAQRTVVLLRFYEGRTQREIARRLDVSVETVRTRLKRGLARLRGALDGRRSREEWMSSLLPLAGAGAGSVVLASGAKLVAAAGLVILAGSLWWIARGAGEPPAGGAAGPVVADAGERGSPEQTPRAATPLRTVEGRAAVQAAAIAPVVEGRALAPGGEPLSGERVYLAREPLHATGLRRFELAVAAAEAGELRLTETGPDGAFLFEPEEAGRFHLGLVHPADPRHHAGRGAWVEAPAKGVELRATAADIAALAVRATLIGTGEDLVGFRADLHSAVTRTYTSACTDGSLLEVEVPLAEGCTEESFALTVEHPSLGRAEKDVILRSGERAEVRLFFEGHGVVSGTVVDEADRSVAGALVFFGIQEALRGDEPFKPYDPTRVQNGVRTDSAGAFELAGRGRWITAWHAELAPATVAATAAERIVLAPRSAVAGVLLDDAGRPVPDAEVVLDRVRRTVTDEEGRFRFAGLEPGIRGIRLADGRMFALDVAPGETLEVELAAGLTSVTVELQQDGLPYWPSPEDRALVIGEARVFSVQDRPVRKGLVELEHLVAGDYWLLTASGLIARARIDAPRVPADVGSARLTIRGAPGRAKLFVAPAEGHELVRLMANRVAQRRIPASGELVVEPLPPGDYVVGAEGEGELGRVRVEGDGAVIEL